LHFEYYDQGGWQLFDWNINSIKISPLTGPSSDIIQSAETPFFQLYPDAIFLGEEQILENEIPQSIRTYQLLDTVTRIGDTGMEVSYGGEITLIFNFTGTGKDYHWTASWDEAQFSSSWSNWWDN